MRSFKREGMLNGTSGQRNSNGWRSGKVRSVRVSGISLPWLPPRSPKQLTSFSYAQGDQGNSAVLSPVNFPPLQNHQFIQFHTRLPPLPPQYDERHRSIKS